MSQQFLPQSFMRYLLLSVLTELAIRDVDKEVIESAQSFGSSTMQMLTKVQFPQALPTIMAGVNQTTMMALAMVVVGSMVGAQGLR